MVLLAGAPARDLVADLVADIVATTRRGTALYSRNRFHAPWGIRVDGGHVASCHVVTAGAGWLLPDGAAPVRLSRGDVVLVPFGAGHSLVDSPGSPVRPLTELIGGPLGETPPRDLVIDGPGPATVLLCGGYLLDAGPAHPLTAALPPVVHVAAARSRDSGLAAAVDLLSDEVERADPGAPAVLTSLVELLFVYVLRAWLAERGGAADGWIRALHDPVVGRALTLVHTEPGRPWSVAALARAVDCPRATFSRRFTALIGQPPMAYVTAWRMAVAARLLREERRPLREVAARVGYDSEFAFARAFKRTVGVAPGRYRTSPGA
ncbi:AraC family transcriptional regulator [Virgisporangium aliadipatigenens]|uniref:AraC family transcriptional regulator n=1 Tax=Virgisporangium aliadipatigenens TaxID=741659 RepID=A0A8J3YLD8_9ACTN|nr:AraC family transcriptional regulator [Virgisporangium aliadipatigenens]GIJ46011.1 AraC family transcriptional regulator [Virgisporangium aliadipatigenens]